MSGYIYICHVLYIYILYYIIYITYRVEKQNQPQIDSFLSTSAPRRTLQSQGNADARRLHQRRRPRSSPVFLENHRKKKWLIYGDLKQKNNRYFG